MYQQKLSTKEIGMNVEDGAGGSGGASGSSEYEPGSQSAAGRGAR